MQREKPFHALRGKRQRGQTRGRTTRKGEVRSQRWQRRDRGASDPTGDRAKGKDRTEERRGEQARLGEAEFLP